MDKQIVLDWIDGLVGDRATEELPDLFVSKWFPSADTDERGGWAIDQCAALFSTLSEYVGARWRGRFSLAMAFEDSDVLRTSPPSAEELAAAIVQPDLYFFEPTYAMAVFDSAARFTVGVPYFSGIGDYKVGEIEFQSREWMPGDYTNTLWFHHFNRHVPD